MRIHLIHRKQSMILQFSAPYDAYILVWQFKIAPLRPQAARFNFQVSLVNEGLQSEDDHCMIICPPWLLHVDTMIDNVRNNVGT